MKVGKLQRKVLLLLLAGFSIALRPYPKHQLRVVKELFKEWNNINKQTLERSVHALYRSKLVVKKNNRDHSGALTLSKEGKKLALIYKLDEVKIKSHAWDGKWRLVIFDVPEKLKKVREALRYHLKRLGFKELQHSVFILPFECHNEMDYLIEFYNARRFVRFLGVDYIDNSLDLKNQFNIK